eukprot:TRINITY_DN8100_c0_g1_i5.p1 TRINITY_DN8100_c0_g1~~TRINITY_DN8100_c0_g1_i5.p1  ORF type:complete len:130 (-),score=8.70 TRINITY_DN8100_c0_g1_i5:62-451(-)
MPYQKSGENYINIYTEIVIVVVFVSVLVINAKEHSEESKNILGWVLIGLILVALCYLWLTSLPAVIKNLYHKIIKPKDSQKQNIESKLETETNRISTEAVPAHTGATNKKRASTVQYSNANIQKKEFDL